MSNILYLLVEKIGFGIASNHWHHFDRNPGSEIKKNHCHTVALFTCNATFSNFCERYSNTNSKDKSSEALFHRITWSYSYFVEYEFLRQFSKKQNMIKKKYQLNRNEKFVDKAQQCFTFLHIKPKFKFAVQ